MQNNNNNKTVDFILYKGEQTGHKILHLQTCWQKHATRLLPLSPDDIKVSIIFQKLFP